MAVGKRKEGPAFDVAPDDLRSLGHDVAKAPTEVPTAPATDIEHVERTGKDERDPTLMREEEAVGCNRVVCLGWPIPGIDDRPLAAASVMGGRGWLF